MLELVRSYLARSRRLVDADWRRRHLFSPVAFGLYHELLPRLRVYASGSALDAGCGTMPFRAYLEPHVTSYESLDVDARAPGVTYTADVQELSAIPAARYDTVLCSEVLEHLPRPEAALRELNRVLRPDGRLLLTVPFLSRLHEEPHDYFRYTAHGLRALLDRSGFETLEIAPTGSVFSFLGHQLSSVIIPATWRIPVLREIGFAVNAALVVLPCYWLDRLVRLGAKLPAGYVAVAAKRHSAAPTPPPGAG